MSFLLYIPLIILLWLVYEIVRPQKFPCNPKNKINKIRLIYFGICNTRLFEDYLSDNVFFTYSDLNWMNRIRLVWDCIRNEDKFFGIPTLWWLGHSEEEIAKYKWSSHNQSHNK